MTRIRLGALFAALAVGCMAAALATQWPSVRDLEIDVEWPVLLAACAGVVGCFFLDAAGWHLVLRALGIRQPVGTSIRIWLLSSLGRYIPGGIWGYVGRVALAQQQGVPTATASLSLYLETLLLCAGALAVGLPALAAASGLGMSPSSAGLLCVALGLMMHPRLLALAGHLPGAVGAAFAAASLPRPAAILGLYGYYVMFWAAFGAVFLVFVRAFGELPAGSGVAIASSMGLSFAIGFVVIFAPGGIGVRESALYLLLLPHLPAAACLVIALTSRLWIMLGEAISLTLALAFLGRPPPAGGASSPARSE